LSLSLARGRARPATEASCHQLAGLPFPGEYYVRLHVHVTIISLAFRSIVEPEPAGVGDARGGLLGLDEGAVVRLTKEVPV